MKSDPGSIRRLSPATLERSGTAGAGGPLEGLTASELEIFSVGKEDFEEEEDVPDGLGPTMNLGSCAGCHLQPSVGGTSPPLSPQIAFANLRGATNTVPAFITRDGPIREARFVRNRDRTPDGGVHDLFTVAGRSDAPGCVPMKKIDIATIEAARRGR